MLSGKGLICCGDDKGTLWLYNLPQYGKDGSPATKSEVEPSKQLQWPELQDDHLVRVPCLFIILMTWLSFTV